DAMTSVDALGWLTTQQELLPEQQMFLERALVYYKELEAEPDNGVDGRQLLVEALGRVGMIYKALGRHPEAEAAYKRAVDIDEHLVAQQPDVLEQRATLAKHLSLLGQLFRDLNRRPEAETTFRRSAELFERLAADHPESSEYGVGVARNRANLLSGLGAGAE